MDIYQRVKAEEKYWIHVNFKEELSNTKQFLFELSQSKPRYFCSKIKTYLKRYEQKNNQTLADERNWSYSKYVRVNS